MILSKFSIKRKITITMFYLIVIGFGIFSFSQLRIDLFPDLTFPVIAVITSYQGVGPEDIENLLTRPLEESVSATKSVNNVHSQSTEGTSLIILEFEWGTDMDQAEIDVRNKIDLIRDYLPNDANSPLVFAFDPSLQPIVYMSLSSPNLGPAELRRLAEDKIETLLERVDGVASVGTEGGLKRQINVKLDPVLLASHNLSTEQVAMSLQTSAGLLPSGKIATTTRNYNLRVFSEYRQLEQIKNTIISMHGGLPVYVKDVANVEDGFRELNSDIRAEFAQGVIVFISKQSDANTVQTVQKVMDILPEIEELLPQGTKFSILWDQGEFIMRSINNLTNTALIAFLMAFLVIYVFLRNWRSSIIMGISIPVSIVATFAVLMAADLTLNIISMAGLALAVGMLVDNSIVVLENIFRHREQGKSLIESADTGTTEVGMAITASTLTTVSVFLPVLFVPGLTGQLFKDMVITISFSLIVSLVIALTLVPMMSSQLLHTIGRKPVKKSRFVKFKAMLENRLSALTNRYQKTLHWSIYHKKYILGITAVLFVLSLGLAKLLGGEFLPHSDQSFVQLRINRAAGTPLVQLRETVLQLEKIVKEEVPEMASLYISFGAQEGWGAFGSSSRTIEALVRLKPREERSRSQFDIQDVLRERLSEIPGITYSFTHGGGMNISGERDVDIKIFGHDLDGAASIAEQIKTRMLEVSGLVDVELNIQESSPELRVQLDQDVLNDFNLSSFQVASIISTAIQGRVAAQYREKGDEYNVYVRLAKAYRQDREALQELLIPTVTGSLVPLKQLGTIEESLSPPTIYRENQERYVSVGCGLSGRDLSSAVDEIKRIIADTPIPSEFTVVIGGTAEDQQESYKYLGLAFIIAILLVYMIMASQFESFVDPLVIMFTVPLSVIGVFIMLFITGTDLSVMALVGLVMLVGISVNNGIVMVDYIKKLRDKGLEMYQAVEKGSLARMRPVLMTALTTSLGMVPLALEFGSGSETWSPLARAVIGGLASTTLLTLLVIPVLYIIFDQMEVKLKKLLKRITG